VLTNTHDPRYSPMRHALSVTADVALTSRSQYYNNTANFSFMFFRVNPPVWGFRSALSQYYRINPSFTSNVIRDQGVWLFGNSNLTSIENHTDFGFKFEEAGGSPAECKVDGPCPAALT
jgi:hypothetical protein